MLHVCAAGVGTVQEIKHVRKSKRVDRHARNHHDVEGLMARAEEIVASREELLGELSAPGG